MGQSIVGDPAGRARPYLLTDRIPGRCEFSCVGGPQLLGSPSPALDLGPRGTETLRPRDVIPGHYLSGGGCLAPVALPSTGSPSVFPRLALWPSLAALPCGRPAAPSLSSNHRLPFPPLPHAGSASPRLEPGPVARPGAYRGGPRVPPAPEEEMARIQDTRSGLPPGVLGSLIATTPQELFDHLACERLGRNPGTHRDGGIPRRKLIAQPSLSDSRHLASLRQACFDLSPRLGIRR